MLVRKPTSVRLHQDVHTHLDALAKQAGRSRSQVIERLIEKAHMEIETPPPLLASTVKREKRETAAAVARIKRRAAGPGRSPSTTRGSAVRGKRKAVK